MPTHIEILFEMYWEDYVKDCANWQRQQLRPGLKDFVQWLDEREIDTGEFTPTYVNTPSFSDLTTN